MLSPIKASKQATWFLFNCIFMFIFNAVPESVVFFKQNLKTWRDFAEKIKFVEKFLEKWQICLFKFFAVFSFCTLCFVFDVFLFTVFLVFFCEFHTNKASFTKNIQQICPAFCFMQCNGPVVCMYVGVLMWVYVYVCKWWNVSF